MPRVLRVDAVHPAPGDVAAAAALLQGGELVGLPTETVYGLAADARNPAAVRRIFAAKGRPSDNPLIVHVAEISALDGLVRTLPPLAQLLAARWWPGPLTLVLDAGDGLPAGVRGGLATVAVRVPAHPVILAVLAAAGLPVAAPSANRSGRPSPTTAAAVVADLGNAVALVLDAGPSPLGVESTVVDARGAVPVILRAGAVTAEDLGLAPATASPSGASPGTRYRHYAPSCRVAVAAPGEGPALAARAAAAGQVVGLVAPGPAPAGVLEIARPGSVEDLARCLYASFRDAEQAGVDLVVVEAVPEVGLGAAVMDRLRRAAQG